MLCLVAACVLAGTVALMFSTFLHPFLAAGAAALVLGLPALASLTLSVRWAYIVPVFILGTAVLKSNFKSPGGLFWFPVGLAFLETFFFWALATVIFSRGGFWVGGELARQKLWLFTETFRSRTGSGTQDTVRPNSQVKWPK